MLEVTSYGERCWINPSHVGIFWEHVSNPQNDPNKTDVYFVTDTDDDKPLVVDMSPQEFALRWNTAMNASF